MQKMYIDQYVKQVINTLKNQYIYIYIYIYMIDYEGGWFK